MGNFKGDEKARGDQMRPAGEKTRPAGQVESSPGRRGRSRRRAHAGRSAQGPTESGETSVAERELAAEDRSGERGLRIGLIDTVGESHPVQIAGQGASATANSNYRADIVPVPPRPNPAYEPVQPRPSGNGMPQPSAPASRVDAASVLDAPASLHESAPPPPASPWALRIWVGLMCAIIGAAGLVALRQQDKSADPLAAKPDEAAEPASKAASAPPPLPAHKAPAPASSPPPAAAVNTGATQGISAAPGREATVPAGKPAAVASGVEARVSAREQAKEDKKDEPRGAADAAGAAEPSRGHRRQRGAALAAGESAASARQASEQAAEEEAERRAGELSAREPGAARPTPSDTPRLPPGDPSAITAMPLPGNPYERETAAPAPQ